MNNRTSIIFLLILAGLVAACLFGISRIRSQKVKEEGHFILSFLPWGHVVISYAVAFYVRIGFGSWPRSCIDNPELPMINGLVMAIVFGLLFVVWLVPPVWIGWLVIRWRQGMKKAWVSSTAVFITGLATVILLQVLDPGNFWEWVWD